jgi:hypothetical protein
VPDLAGTLKMLVGLTILDQSVAKLDAGEITKCDLRNTDDWGIIFAPIKPMINTKVITHNPLSWNISGF